MNCDVCGERSEIKIKSERYNGEQMFFLECTKCGVDYADHVILKLNILLKNGSMNYEEFLGAIK